MNRPRATATSNYGWDSLRSKDTKPEMRVRRIVRADLGEAGCPVITVRVPTGGEQDP